MERRRLPARPRAVQRWLAEANLRRVIATFTSRSIAEEAADDLSLMNLAGATIALEDRRETADRPPRPSPAVERIERRRDAHMAGHVLRDAVLRATLHAVGGTIVAALIGFLAFPAGSPGRAIALALGAVAGAVLGAIRGGGNAAMTQSPKEAGTLLVVEAPDEQTARRAVQAVRRHHPSRVDLTPDRRAG